MRLRMFAILVVALMAVASSVFSTAALGKAPSQHKDPISGEWKGSFETQDGGTSFIITLKFKLNGDKVTGAIESERGGGTITGSWAADELNVAIETDHGTLALTGALKEGKLVGQWDAGHAEGKWEAKKK